MTTTATVLPPPPTLFGAAFANVVAQVTGWSRDRVAEANLAFNLHLPPGGDQNLWATADLMEENLDAAGLISPGQAREDGPPSARRWIEDCDDLGDGLGAVAGAVLARDFGLVTADDFDTLTRWWTDAGMTLPGSGAEFPADRAAAGRNAAALRSWQDHIEDWPATAAGQPHRTAPPPAVSGLRDLLAAKLACLPAGTDLDALAAMIVAALRYDPQRPVVDPGPAGDEPAQPFTAVVGLACLLLDAGIGLTEDAAVSTAAIAVLACGYDLGADVAPIEKEQ